MKHDIWILSCKYHVRREDLWVIGSARGSSLENARMTVETLQNQSLSARGQNGLIFKDP